MSNFTLTLIATIILMALAILCLIIGWLITGKVKIQRGSCGFNPHKKDNKKRSQCGSKYTCELCTPEVNASKNLKKEEKDNEHTHN